MLPDRNHPFVAEIYREVTYIRENLEDDWTWMDEGLDLLEEGMFESAVIRFRELLVAQPEGLDAYEGLALTYRETGDRKRARYFIEQAIERARLAAESGAIDQDALNELYAERDAIFAMPEAGPDADAPGGLGEEPSPGGSLPLRGMGEDLP